MPKAKTVTVTIGEASYPCRMSMGAMLRFKRETGKEVSEIKEGSISDMAVLLYCCVASACNAEHKPFNLSLEDFCDAISSDDMSTMTAAIQGEAEEGADQSEEGKKK